MTQLEILASELYHAIRDHNDSVAYLDEARLANEEAHKRADNAYETTVTARCKLLAHIRETPPEVEEPK